MGEEVMPLTLLRTNIISGSYPSLVKKPREVVRLE